MRVRERKQTRSKKYGNGSLPSECILDITAAIGPGDEAEVQATVAFLLSLKETAAEMCETQLFYVFFLVMSDILIVNVLSTRISLGATTVFSVQIFSSNEGCEEARGCKASISLTK